MTAQQGAYGGRKVREGTVVSDKMEKTVLVAVRYNVRHRLYKKIVRRTRKFMAHDETEQAHMGDVVRIVESAPISRNKRWRVVQVLTAADLPDVAPESIDLELLGEVKPEEQAQPAAEVAPAPVADIAEETPAPPEAPASTAEPAPEVESVEEATAEPVAEAPAPESEAESATEAPASEAATAGEPEPAVEAEPPAVDSAAVGQAEDGEQK